MGERAVAYIRVSREDENPDNQRFVIEQFCKEKNLDCLFFPPEIGIARTEDPFQRPILRQIFDFMIANRINILIVESIDRFIAEPEYWDKVLEFFAKNGIKLISVKDKDLTDSFTKIIETLEEVKKVSDSAVFKVILEHEIENLKNFVRMYHRVKVAIAKEYVEDVRYKTKRAIEKLKNEGKVYHRPNLVHYLALYITGKKYPRELSQEEIEHARNLFCNFVKSVAGDPLTGSIKLAWREFLKQYKPLFDSQQTAPRSYLAFLKTYKKMCLVVER